MHPLYEQVLTRSVPAYPAQALTDDPPESAGYQPVFVNAFSIPVNISVYGNNEKQLLAPGETTTWQSYYAFTLVVQSALTGSFMCAVTVSQAVLTYTFDYALLTPPNDIGPVPTATQQMLVPADSQRVMVGCSLPLPDGTVIVREQFWALHPSSVTLMPGETKTFSSTVTTGMQRTSSSETTVAESLSASASAGFMSFSATMSASLNETSTVLQQVTLTDQTVTYVSDTLTNPYTGDDAQVCFVYRWQLTEVLSIIPAEDVTPVDLAKHKKHKKHEKHEKHEKKEEKAQREIVSLISGKNPLVTVSIGQNILPPSPGPYALPRSLRQGGRNADASR